MKRFFLIATILFCAAVAAILVEVVRRSFEEKGSPRHLRRIASQINGAHPEGSDGVFEMTATAGGDKSLTVRYRMLEEVAADYDAVALREVRENLRNKACTHDGLRELLEAGVTLRVIVVDGEDAPITTTELLRWECGSFTPLPSR